MAKKYIAKPDTWFKEGTECKLIDDYRPGLNSGLFEGLRICENPDVEAGIPKGTERVDDQEVCSFDEFIEVDE